MCTTNYLIYAPRVGSPGPTRAGGGAGGPSDGKDEVRCVGSGLLWGHGLLIISWPCCGDRVGGS